MTTRPRRSRSMTGGSADGGGDDGADVGVEVAGASRADKAKMADVVSRSVCLSLSLYLSLSEL